MGRREYISVYNCKIRNGNLKFRRWVPGFPREQWENIKNYVLTLDEVDSMDNIRWKWTSSSMFTVKSTYEQLTQIESRATHKNSWEAKIPLKIKYFLWAIENDACIFCKDNETINHLFFECKVAKSANRGMGIYSLLDGANCTPYSIQQCWL